jgi:urease accessory protein
MTGFERSVHFPIQTVTDLLVRLLADARFPSSDPAHSGGIEEACACGWVTSAPELGEFLQGRLWTVGATAAFAAAAVCARSLSSGGGALPDSLWRSMESEIDARALSPAARATSRAQGGQLLSMAMSVAPDAVLYSLARATAGDDQQPHHAVAVGAVAAAAGVTPQEAAAVAAQAEVTGAAEAGKDLLKLSEGDFLPIVTQLGRGVSLLSVEAAKRALRSVSEFPAVVAPGLAFLAEDHVRKEGRIYAS